MTRAKEKIWIVIRYLSVLVLFATQLILWIDSWTMLDTMEPLNFFGYWTNQSNILGIAALLIAAAYTGKPRPAWVEIVRFAATVNLIMVTVLYWLFVQGDDVGVRFVWANYMVHLVAGAIITTDWLVEGPRKTVTISKLWIASVYPLIWLIITGVRYLVDEWVPYAVLEPRNGVAAISGIAAAFLLSSILFGAIIIIISKFRVYQPAKPESFMLEQ